MTLITRYVRRRGEWVAMVTNILPDQVARAEADPERGEEEAVHVPNALAVRAPELLEAAKRALVDLEAWVEQELSGTDMHDSYMADLDYLRNAITAAEDDDGDDLRDVVEAYDDKPEEPPYEPWRDADDWDEALGDDGWP